LSPGSEPSEEFFEYDAEDFLGLLTLLITEGRTPECSVKGRTEGLHCPPAQSAMPPLHRHECSDKLPQCRQASRTRSEVMLLWRNGIPIMIEVMLLPDCCYGDECPPNDLISDPVIKQDALLLERWSLQPMPRQSGDRFIEEKTLLLAVRSYVFFSQLSAWLSASHGIVPRNILYRISPADEELLWQFSQPPSEHLFPVPNVSQSVALRVRVQSLPRQPTYPTLACSIHTGLPWPGKSLGHGPRPDPSALRKAPERAHSPRPAPPGKAVRWLYSALNGGPLDPAPPADDGSKAAPAAPPMRAFKAFSLAEPARGPSPRPLETNPLIGSLLQDRQEVIARIAQRLNFCDPGAPPLPAGLFAPGTVPKATWGGGHDDHGRKTKEADRPPPGEAPAHARPPAFRTPEGDPPERETARDRERETSGEGERERDCSLIAQAVQDISRLIQERLSLPSSSPPTHSRSGYTLRHTHSTTITHTVRTYTPGPTTHPTPQGPPVATSCTVTACRGGNVLTTVIQVYIPAASTPHSPPPHSLSPPQRSHSSSPLRPCNSWKKQNRHSLDGMATKAFHPCTGLPLLSSPVPQRKNQTGYFDLDASLTGCNGLPWASGKRVSIKRGEEVTEESHQLFSASAPPAGLSLLGNFEECVLNYRLEPLGNVDGFIAEVGASGSFCPSHMTLPVDVSFYSVSEDNAPSPYMGVINLESLGKRGYRVPPSGTIQVTLFNPNKTVVKMFVVMYDLRALPAGHQTFLRQRTFSIPVRRGDAHNHNSRKPLPLGPVRTLRYLIHLRFQCSKSGKVYLHRDIRLLFSRKSMEVDSGAAYELQSFIESPADPPFSARC
uniref:Atos homolog protein A n=1 Tax=Gadus morhua TaxID=8049 RepID=A0A8C4ZKV1_GADMO